MGNAPFFQKCLHLLTGDQKHGADNAATNRRNSAQPSQAGSPDQVHQYGFGIVVSSMSGGYFSGETFQKSVAGLPGCRFQSLFPWGNGSGAHMQRNLIVAAEVRNKSGIPL